MRAISAGGRATLRVKFPGNWRDFFDDNWHDGRPNDRHGPCKPTQHNIVDLMSPIPDAVGSSCETLAARGGATGAPDLLRGQGF
jgi:hypothetical protein